MTTSDVTFEDRVRLVSARVQGVRSVRDITIKFGDLTVLVGTNGAGKSALIEAVSLPGRLLEEGLAGLDTGYLASLFPVGSDNGIEITFRYAGSGFDGTYKVVLERPNGLFASEEVVTRGPDGSIRSSHTRTQLPRLSRETSLLSVAPAEEVERVADLVRRTQVYWANTEAYGDRQPKDLRQPMSTCSDNSASTLTLLQQNERYVDFIDAIERVTGDIHDVNVREHLGKLEVELTKTDGTVLSPSQVSHGTLRSIDLMLALMQPQDLVLFGYEEPEVHVHPAMATLLVELLIEASAREQVLITTHSPDVLRQVGPDDVRVVSKADGYTTVAPLLERQRRAVHERLLGLDDIQRLEGLRPQPLVAAT